METKSLSSLKMETSQFKSMRWLVLNVGETYNNKYLTCDIENVNITQPNQRISLVEQTEIKSRDDVEGAVVSTSSSIKYFPTELYLQFPNLVALQIEDSGLLSIKRSDLQGFNKLKELWLSNNRIKDLPENLFLELPSLEMIDFRSNAIETIAEKILEPLKNLKYCDLRGNVNIDLCFVKEKPSKGATLDMINRQIKERCQLSDDDPVRKYIQQLWEGNCSDFIIEVGTEDFKVHKSILAINSPVFEAMFRQDMLENQKNKMSIVDFSAEVVEMFLEFIYLRKMSKPEMNFLELYSIAAKYQVEELKKITKSTLMQSLSQDNAYEIFLLGHLYDDEFLKSQAFSLCSRIIGGNLPQVLKNHPEKVKKLLEENAIKETTVASAELRWLNSFKEFTDIEEMS